MKSTVKKLCCLIPALILLICIISVPTLWFTISDRNLYADNHPLSKVDFSLSSEISDIPLVYRIHKLLDSYYSEAQHVVADTDGEGRLEITLTSNDGIDTEEKSYSTEPTEWKKLTQYENLNSIIKMSIGESNLQCVIESAYDDDNMVDIMLGFENGLEVQYVYDTESQKILRLSLPKLAGKQLDAEEKQKAMEEFIAYLNLDILEDWYDNGDSIISNKAHLSLSFQENEEQWSLGFSIV